ncbi:hypothetical protein [Trichothermofontia sp.]
MPKPATLREYPPTTNFPTQLAQLERQELERVYLELRQNYKGLSISRGQLIGKVQTLRQQLEAQERQLAHVMQTLAAVAQEKQELYAVLDELEAVNRKQKALIAEVKDEFEAVKADKSLGVLERLNRIMRAVYQLLYQDLNAVINRKAKTDEDDPDQWAKQDPASVNRSLLDDR